MSVSLVHSLYACFLPHLGTMGCFQYIRLSQHQLKVRHVQPPPELPAHFLHRAPKLEPMLGPELHRPFVLRSHARCTFVRSPRCPPPFI